MMTAEQEVQQRSAPGGKVVVNRTMSLDGFVAGPGDAMDWVFRFVTPDQIPDVMHATGAILCGRRTYDVGRRDTGKISGEAYGGLWDGPVFVLTHRTPAMPDSAVSDPAVCDPAVSDPAVSDPAEPGPALTFLSGDITSAVATAKAAAGDKDVELLGTDIATQCLRRGLVDEIFVLVLPVLLGGGTPLFAPAGLGQVNLEPLNLEPVSTGRVGSATSMRFRVVAPCAG
jgi:dihydrofolate reductase